MKVACYARVAHNDQLVLNNQVRSIREYADSSHYDTVAVISENGVTDYDNGKGIESILRLSKEG